MCRFLERALRSCFRVPDISLQKQTKTNKEANQQQCVAFEQKQGSTKRETPQRRDSGGSVSVQMRSLDLTTVIRAKPSACRNISTSRADEEDDEGDELFKTIHSILLVVSYEYKIVFKMFVTPERIFSGCRACFRGSANRPQRL